MLDYLEITLGATSIYQSLLDTANLLYSLLLSFSILATRLARALEQGMRGVRLYKKTVQDKTTIYKECSGLVGAEPLLEGVSRGSTGHVFGK
jgi:hypothetical protein